MDRQLLSGSLDVTAGSGIWDAEGGATIMTQLLTVEGNFPPSSGEQITGKLHICNPK